MLRRRFLAGAGRGVTTTAVGVPLAAAASGFGRGRFFGTGVVAWAAAAVGVAVGAALAVAADAPAPLSAIEPLPLPAFDLARGDAPTLLARVTDAWPTDAVLAMEAPVRSAALRMRCRSIFVTERSCFSYTAPGGHILTNCRGHMGPIAREHVM